LLKSSPQDYLLFWELSTGCDPLTEAQIELDRLELLALLALLDPATRQFHIIPRHAESLLKAIGFGNCGMIKNTTNGCDYLIRLFGSG